MAITALLIGAVMYSCGSDSGLRDYEGFLPAETLTADSVAIQEIFHPSWGNIFGDYAVLVNRTGGKVLFRYHLPDWTFVDSSFVQGGGPQDLLYAFMEGSNCSDNSFWLSEPPRNEMMKYEMDAQGLKKVRSVRMNEKPTVYFGEVFDDEVVVCTDNDGESGQVHLYAGVLGDTLTWEDSVRCHTKVTVMQEVRGEMIYTTTWTYNHPQIKSSGDRLAIWYPNTENLAIYRIRREGMIVFEKMWGNPLTYEMVEAVDPQQKKAVTYTQSIVGATDKYLYFQKLTFDKPDSEATRENPLQLLSSEIKVYDWSMNPVKKFELDKMIFGQVFVDESKGKIYMYDRRTDFEQVYIYDYEL